MPRKNIPPLCSQDTLMTHTQQLGNTASRETNIILANEKIDLDLVLSNLSGREQKQGDHLDLAVNQQEARLVTTIEEAMFNVGVPFVFKSFWPNEAEMCCVITHDVDWFTYSPFHKVVLGGPLGLRGFIGLLYAYISGKDLGWNVPTILSINRPYGTKSTFFFRTGYDSLDTYLEKSVELLKSEDYDVGLHAAHFAHSNIDALRSEIELLSRRTRIRPNGIRHHIYKFNIPETWALESSLGLQYDATFSYNRFFGFRSELCYPYHPFGESRLPILELPTSFMDWTALHRGRRGADTHSMVQSIIKRVKEYHGVFVSNFHNTYLNPHTFPDIVNAYTGLLDEATKQKYWVATAQQCIDWWGRRSSEKPRPVQTSAKAVSVHSSFPLVINAEAGRKVVVEVTGS